MTPFFQEPADPAEPLHRWLTPRRRLLAMVLGCCVLVFVFVLLAGAIAIVHEGSPGVGYGIGSLLRHGGRAIAHHFHHGSHSGHSGHTGHD